MIRTLELVKKFRKTDNKTPDRADGLFQSHPCLWHGALHPRRGGGGRRRLDRGGSAARRRRSAAASRPGAGAGHHSPGHAHLGCGAAGQNPRWRQRLSLLCLDRRRHRHQEFRRRPGARGGGAHPQSHRPAGRGGLWRQDPGACRARSPRIADAVVVGSAIVEPYRGKSWHAQGRTGRLGAGTVPVPGRFYP